MLQKYNFYSIPPKFFAKVFLAFPKYSQKVTKYRQITCILQIFPKKVRKNLHGSKKVLTFAPAIQK